MSKHKSKSETPTKKELEEQIGKLNEAKLQVMADFENYRRRMEQEKAKFAAMANKDLLEDLMEIIDDISLASKDQEMNIERAQEMMSLLSEKILNSVKRYNVTKIEIASGDTFDPNTMEAITVVPVPTEQDGKVVEIISSGYKYESSGELIKNAKVIVGKAD